MARRLHERVRERTRASRRAAPSISRRLPLTFRAPGARSAPPRRGFACRHRRRRRRRTMPTGRPAFRTRCGAGRRAASTGADDADRRWQRIGVPPQRPRVPVVHVHGAENDARGRGWLQLPETIRHLHEQRNAALQVHHADHSTATPSTTRSRSVVVLLDGDADGGARPAAARGRISASTRYVRFASTASGGTGFDPQAFKRIDITPTGVLVNGVAGANPSGRTIAQEMRISRSATRSTGRA